MFIRPIHAVTGAAVLLAAAGSIAVPATVGAETIRSRGTGNNVDISWIEYDPDDVLGLPGNTHVGYLYGYSGQYGTYFGGNVTDFECDPGEYPWGGHGVTVEVVDEAAETTDAAIGDAIDGIVDSGGSEIDAAVVRAEVQEQLADDVPDAIHDEFEEVPTCDYIQDRFLEGNETTRLTVDAKATIARITGTINVTNGHGGHDGDVTVLATPPVDVTVAGGEWSAWESTYSSRGESYSYSTAEKGTSWYGGTVTGRIGPMGFADDADDEAYGGFGTSSYRSVERVR